MTKQIEGIFEVNEEYSKDKSIMTSTEETEGIIKEIERHVIHLSRYFSPKPEVKAAAKYIKGARLSIQSVRGEGYVEFPEYDASNFEKLLDEQIKWKKEIKYFLKEFYRKITTYELDILTGPLKNKRFLPPPIKQ